MKKNIHNAEALYDGGWRADDKEELMKEYNLTADEADDICSDLEDIAKRDINSEKRYIVVDEKGMDIFEKVFEDKKAANEYAESEWDRLTNYDKKDRHIYVTDVHSEDLSEDCFEDGEVIDWTGYSQSGYEDGLWDSEK